MADDLSDLRAKHRITRHPDYLECATCGDLGWKLCDAARLLDRLERAEGALERIRNAKDGLAWYDPKDRVTCGEVVEALDAALADGGDRPETLLVIDGELVTECPHCHNRLLGGRPEGEANSDGE